MAKYYYTDGNVPWFDSDPKNLETMQTLDKGQADNKLPKVSGREHLVSFFVFHL